MVELVEILCELIFALNYGVNCLMNPTNRDVAEHHHRALRSFHWWMVRERYTRSTLKSYYNFVRRFLEHHPEWHPNELTHLHVDIFIKKHADLGLQDRTLNGMRCAIILFIELHGTDLNDLSASLGTC
jgi:hypothetical protein